jgi:CDP-glycerol glycerophosphotransferase
VGAPVLSIVVPVYLVDAYLSSCLDSILSQVDADSVEVVAVDDGSTDLCGAMLDEAARRDPRLHVVHHQRNMGTSHARNAGLARARGDYVWFVDADDWLPEGSLYAVCERLRASRPDVLIVEHAEVFPDGRTVHRSFGRALGGLTGPVQLTDKPRLLRLAQSACTKVVRRGLLDDTGLRFLPGWYEDCSFSHPLLMAAERIELLDRVCYHYRQRPQSITSTVSPRHFEVFDQYQRLFAMVEAARGPYDVFRPELFRVMINHYLVIMGNDSRLPSELRRAFFRRVVEDYRRLLPPGGYPLPAGSAGLKHRLVRYHAFRAYTGLRMARSGIRRMRKALVFRGSEPVNPPVPSTATPTTAASPPTVPLPRSVSAHEHTRPEHVESTSGGNGFGA